MRVQGKWRRGRTEAQIEGHHRGRYENVGVRERRYGIELGAWQKLSGGLRRRVMTLSSRLRHNLMTLSGRLRRRVMMLSAWLRRRVMMLRARLRCRVMTLSGRLSRRVMMPSGRLRRRVMTLRQSLSGCMRLTHLSLILATGSDDSSNTLS